MPLINFGSILSFAEELEKQDLAFYTDAAGNPAGSIHSEMFAQFVKEAKKNITNIQRTRRENVTEMILENVEGFTRAPYCTECGVAVEMETAEIIATAHRLEDRAVRYYMAAAEKLKAQSEVARVLKQLGKKHTARQAKLAPL
jgi:rubrerythrin